MLPKLSFKPKRRSTAVRCLFGPVDHVAEAAWLNEEAQRIISKKTNQYNFNFITGEPIQGSSTRYQWSEMPVPPILSELERVTDMLTKRADQRDGQAPAHSSSMPLSVDTAGPSHPGSTVTSLEPSPSRKRCSPGSSADSSALKQSRLIDFFKYEKRIDQQSISEKSQQNDGYRFQPIRTTSH